MTDESKLIEKLIRYEGFLVRQMLDADDITKPIRRKRVGIFARDVSAKEIKKQELAESQVKSYVSALERLHSDFPEIRRIEIYAILNVVDRKESVGERTLEYTACPAIVSPDGLGGGMFSINSKRSQDMARIAKSNGYSLYFPSDDILKLRGSENSLAAELTSDEKQLMTKVWQGVK